MKVNKDLRTIYVIAIVNITLLISFGHIYTHPDTSSYVEAWNTITSGNIDPLRTPTYPLFLGLMMTVFGENFMLPAVIGQYFVFLCSIYCFHYISRQTNLKEQYAFWTTLIYAVCPGICTWCNSILTEGLAMSGCVIFIYSMVKLKEHLSLYSAFLYCGILALLIFLRPALIYILPITLLTWVGWIYRKEFRKQSLVGIAGIIVVTAMLLSYMATYKQKYGLFATSNVGVLNGYFIDRWHGLLHPEEIENDSLRVDIQKSVDKYGLFWTSHIPNRWAEEDQILWEETYYITNKYNHSELSQVFRESMLHHPLGHIASVLYRADWAGKQTLLQCHGGMFWGILCGWCLGYITISLLYIVLIIYLFIMIYRIKHKHVSWITLITFLMGVANLAVAVAGAQEDWNRLIAPSLPFYLLIFADLCRYIKIVRPNVTTLKC